MGAARLMGAARAAVLFAAVAGALLSIEVCASPEPMRVEMSAEIPLSYCSAEREFTGNGYMRVFAEDAYAHRIIDVKITDELVMDTPSGTKKAPEGTAVSVSSTLSARMGAYNMYAASGEYSDVYMNVRLPLTEEFAEYGSGGYRLIIPLTLTMTAAYGSYKADFTFSPWDKLCSEGGISLDESGCVLQEVSVTDDYLEIPPAITQINGGAFIGAGTVEVTIPATVTEAGEAFMESGVGAVVFDPGRSVVPKAICKNAPALTRVEFGEGIRTFEESAFNGCSALTLTEIPDTLETLGAYCLHGTSRIKRLEIKRNLNVEAYSAAGAPLAGSGIEEIYVHEGVTEIPARLYSNATALKRLYLPGSLKSIGGQAFSNAASLKELCLRSDITTAVARSPFEGSGLERITIAPGVTQIPANLFSGACSSLKELYLPASIKKIGNNAFSGADEVIIYYAGSEEDWYDVNTGAWLPENLVFEAASPASNAVTPVGAD